MSIWPEALWPGAIQQPFQELSGQLSDFNPYFCPALHLSHCKDSRFFSAKGSECRCGSLFGRDRKITSSWVWRIFKAERNESTMKGTDCAFQKTTDENITTKEKRVWNCVQAHKKSVEIRRDDGRLKEQLCWILPHFLSWVARAMATSVKDGKMES